MENINEAIALNILQVSHDEIKITHAYNSEYNHTHKNQVVLLMITDGEKCHFTALKSEPTEDGFNGPTKSLSELFRGITSNNQADFYCLNCLHSFGTDNALKNMKDCVKIMIIAELPTKPNKILKYNHGEHL